MSSVVISGDTSGAVTLTVPAVAGTNTVTIPAVTGTAVVSGQNSAITVGTAQASTSGTSIDFTNIPSWVKRITVMMNGVSNTGADSIIVYRLGTVSGIEATGYNTGVGLVSTVSNNTTRGASNTTGFLTVHGGNGNDVWYGSIVFSNMGSNTWVGSATHFTSIGSMTFTSGAKVLAGTLTQIRITSINGTDTFDAGSVNILYE